MAKYAQATDCVDAVLSVSELNLIGADIYVDLELGKLGITPAEAATIPLPNPALTMIASTWAKSLAAIDGAMGDNSLLMDKAKLYKASAEVLVKSLNRASLGFAEPTGAGFGTFTLGRG